MKVGNRTLKEKKQFRAERVKQKSSREMRCERGKNGFPSRTRGQRSTTLCRDDVVWRLALMWLLLLLLLLLIVVFVLL